MTSSRVGVYLGQIANIQKTTSLRINTVKITGSSSLSPIEKTTPAKLDVCKIASSSVFNGIVNWQFVYKLLHSNEDGFWLLGSFCVNCCIIFRINDLEKHLESCLLLTLAFLSVLANLVIFQMIPEEKFHGSMIRQPYRAFHRLGVMISIQRWTLTSKYGGVWSCKTRYYSSFVNKCAMPYTYKIIVANCVKQLNTKCCTIQKFIHRR